MISQMRVKKTRLTEAELVDQQVAPSPAQPATAEDVASAQSAMDGTMTDPNAVADPNGGVDDQNAMAEEPVMDGALIFFRPLPELVNGHSGISQIRKFIHQQPIAG